ncbi:MgtC/SapB family protein [Cohnella zeiphila]|uniref:MgtC/SapB family protein n=1 Tax=Cohnella zeiphila TaxID=2761120 RepID=A0A7X0STG3_9BACL|nr:MgtC/SapB family protein [Cohnella zeiphila]MBB6735829.1 MgtC/SapB family protein [Cohnella zeiphila]
MEFEWLLRVVIAGICGACIGYERKNRMKEAGIKTHFIVAVGASLMMVISKYGFRDQLGWDNLTLDPSRIAAQVVSGVSFLGAGMIFLQKMTVKGLTTAAGVWATAGTGMATGAGLYAIGIGVTVIILVAQTALHSPLRWFSSSNKQEHLVLKAANDPGVTERILGLLKERQIAVERFLAEMSDEGEWTLELFVKWPPGGDAGELLALLQRAGSVTSVELKG